MPLTTKDDGKTLVVYLTGSVGGDILSEEVEQILASSESPTVDARITSRGGSVVEGLAVYDKLRSSGKRVITTVEGGALSAGVIIALAGDERRMYSNGLLFVHGPLAAGGATRQEHQASLDMLQAAENSIVETIVQRTGINEAKARSMMTAEGLWMNAREAQMMGFVTQVIRTGAVADIDFVRLMPAEAVNELGITQQEEPEEMAETPKEPQAATAKQIEAACKGATPAFVLDQLKNDATLDQAKDAFLAVLADQLADAKAEAEAARKEAEDARAEAEKLRAAKTRHGVDPVGSAGETPQQSAREQWDELLNKYRNEGFTASQAASRVAKKYPEIRAAMIEEANA